MNLIQTLHRFIINEYSSKGFVKINWWIKFINSSFGFISEENFQESMQCYSNLYDNTYC